MWFRIEGNVGDLEASLAGLVDLPLSIATDPMSDVTWLKINEINGDTVNANQVDLVTRLSVLPGRPFHADENGNLTQAGHRLSAGNLPADLNWIPLAEALRLEWPTAALAGRWTDPPTELRLVRGGSVREPSGIMVTLEHLGRWVDTAPGVRLRRLQWIHDGTFALVAGHPLPPLEGAAFVRQQDIWTPVGWTWQPAIPSESVRKIFGCSDQEILIWQSTHQFEILSSDAWGSLSRASLREVIAT